VWRRAKAVSGYLAGKKVMALAEELDVTRGAINRWLQWYEAMGAEGLRTGKATGAKPRLTQEQRGQLAAMIESGPQAAGFSSGLWTGPMIGDLIRQRYGISYHNHYVPELLHQLGFSVQRPRKRLARADAAKQEVWLRERFPAIKKKRERAGAS
jgi:transposase